ncbi:hypothetical protein NSK_005001 [Nannochloropsis salina CCMP1776]|uniref:Uncharacterized protein n=1 Tax=Nannochloropsis salina CCMP1776 TaxID=1027361 RepID=A0A4D9CZB9_9STRA|nr:hypothetical protein NSK_005001 [Nannochloropsis salina CCMP1776]|eukprot:TFJ83904.1 hypothetical protein NSK_005001 [Nannochloropsis salina CCMP1776]
MYEDPDIAKKAQIPLISSGDPTLKYMITKDLSSEGRFDVPGGKRGACQKYLNLFAQKLVAARLEPTKNRSTVSNRDPPWCDSVDSNTV